jgi:hypothetical protein
MVRRARNKLLENGVYHVDGAGRVELTVSQLSGIDARVILLGVYSRERIVDDFKSFLANSALRNVGWQAGLRRKR